MQTVVNVLEQAATFFQNARRSLIAGAELLYKIRQGNLWEGQYSSFAEYVEDECQISRGQASKLLTVYEHFVITHGVSQRNLEGADMEKLYLATSLEVEPEQALIRAKTLTRQELRDELSSGPQGDCAHDCEHFTLCGRCNRRVYEINEG